MIAFFGTDGGVLFSGFDSLGTLNSIGNNLGNAIFHNAVYNYYKGPKFLVNTGSDTDFINENCRALIIPAANQVNPAWDLVDWAKFIERIEIPIICIGLGAQFANVEVTKLDLKPNTIRFLEILSKKCELIGVRGEFTKKILNELGISNTIVTGCPSILNNTSLKGSDIQKQIIDFKQYDFPSLCVALGTLEAGNRNFESQIHRLLLGRDYFFLVQTGPLLIKFLREEIEGEELRHVEWVGKIIRPDLKKSEFFSLLKHKGLYYSDAKSWIDSALKFQLTIGMRIHAAISAILGGSLGLCICFDSRTEELVDTMGLPKLLAGDLENKKNIFELVNKASFEADKFDEKFNKNLAAISQVLADKTI